jgi:cell wall-associated NlpC family hydrolase
LGTLKKGGGMGIFFQKSLRFLVLFLVCQATAYGGGSEKLAGAQKLLVNVAVANLRSTRSEMNKNAYEEMDVSQTSQVLFGEKLLLHQKIGKWLQVKALDQDIFFNGKWYHCVGWLKENQVVRVDKFSAPRYDPSIHPSIHPSIQRLRRHSGRTGRNSGPSRREIRKKILETAKKFLGTPYLWGGRSFHNPEFTRKTGQLTGVDCSGFVNLCHLVHGIKIPRNTVSQYQKCKKIKFGKSMDKCDLIFISRRSDAAEIYHVMLYMGGDFFIEAKGRDIRRIIVSSGSERFGKEIKNLKSGDRLGSDFVYFGSLI